MCRFRGYNTRTGRFRRVSRGHTVAAATVASIESKGPLIGSGLEVPGQTIALPVELRKNVKLARTSLVSRMFESWGEIPFVLLQQLDLRYCLCGYIGLEDYTLYPLIRPGSFVEIDARQNKVKPGS